VRCPQQNVCGCTNDDNNHRQQKSENVITPPDPPTQIPPEEFLHPSGTIADSRNDDSSDHYAERVHPSARTNEMRLAQDVGIPRQKEGEREKQKQWTTFDHAVREYTSSNLGMIFDRSY
jgi:hypothetical protein